MIQLPALKSALVVDQQKEFNRGTDMLLIFLISTRQQRQCGKRTG